MSLSARPSWCTFSHRIKESKLLENLLHQDETITSKFLKNETKTRKVHPKLGKV